MQARNSAVGRIVRGMTSSELITMPISIIRLWLQALQAAFAGGLALCSVPEAAAQEREGYAVTPDSVRLWYRVVGEGKETVLVPVSAYHGTQLDRLAKGRRLVLYDPRGRGRSDSVPPSKVSLDHQIRDLETIRKTVGAPQVALIGWSGLGMELFVYALRHPGRVTRLVQLAPVPPRRDPYMQGMMADRRSRTDSIAWTSLQARKARGEFDADEERWCRELSRVTRPASFGDPRFTARGPEVCMFPNEWPSRLSPYFDALLGSFGAFDWRRDLSKVRTPRLVIHGERDNIPLEGNKEWVSGQPEARLLVIRGAGHWPHYERSKETLGAIESFLQGHWPEGSRPVAANQ
jgi:pimeloyl-ACP methyl ester carboxylesterase